MASFILLVLNFKVVDYLIDPIVAGTSAGDPDSLSVSTSIWVFCFLFLVIKQPYLFIYLFKKEIFTGQ